MPVYLRAEARLPLPKNLDFSSISDAVAKRLLEKHATDIDVAARRYGRDHCEFVAIGRIAVLEAHLTYAEGRNCSQETWTKRIIRWRMDQEMKRIIDIPIDPSTLVDISNGYEPEELYARAFAREAIGRLDPREATVMWCRLRGFQVKEIASQLGISTKAVWDSEKKALEILHRWAAKDSHL